MTPPRIISTTPPPKRLFPPLPAEVEQLLAPEAKDSGEPVPPLQDGAPERSSPWQRLAAREAVAAACAAVAVLWTVYATLVLAGVPLPSW